MPSLLMVSRAAAHRAPRGDAGPRRSKRPLTSERSHGARATAARPRVNVVECVLGRLRAAPALVVSVAAAAAAAFTAAAAAIAAAADHVCGAPAAGSQHQGP
jgi:hypothetical protein